MDFGGAIRTGFARYATFRGRASRSEYWWWVLFVVLVSVVLNVLATSLIAFGTGPDKQLNAVGTVGVAASLLNSLFALAVFLPGLAVTVRRLHDTDHSGWWYFIVFTIIGAIPLLIWMCTRGTPGANRFGLGTTADIAGVFGDESVGYAGAAPGYDRTRA